MKKEMIFIIAIFALAIAFGFSYNLGNKINEIEQSPVARNLLPSQLNAILAVGVPSGGYFGLCNNVPCTNITFAQFDGGQNYKNKIKRLEDGRLLGFYDGGGYLRGVVCQNPQNGCTNTQLLHLGNFRSARGLSFDIIDGRPFIANVICDDVLQNCLSNPTYSVEAIHCDTPDCTCNNGSGNCQSAHTRTIIDGINGESQTDASIDNAVVVIKGSNNKPLIFYGIKNSSQYPYEHIKVAECKDYSCIQFQTKILYLTHTDAGDHIDAALGADGNPVLIFRTGSYPGQDTNLLILSCNDYNCMGNFNTRNLEGPNAYAGYPNRLQIGIDGNPVVMSMIQPEGSGNAYLGIFHCDDPICQGNVDETYFQPLFVQAANMAIASDGKPTIILHTTANDGQHIYEMKSAHCQEIDCTDLSSSDFVSLGYEIGYHGMV